jgi:hypothetical protein
MIKGPWWTPPGRCEAEPSQPAGQRAGRDEREAAGAAIRNVDSGVWMGSDGSEEPVDAFGAPQQARGGRLRVPRKFSVPVAEVHAAAIVEECVDRGKETVDLDNLGLSRLTPSIIEPLRQLIRHSHDDLLSPPSEDEYAALTPSIQLYLSRNRLTTLPAELFNLEHIVVLSVRNNELRELPPSIARLRKLKELNIAGNAIRRLPWELLGILHAHGRNHTIHVRPNPLIRPVNGEEPSRLEAMKKTPNGPPPPATDLHRFKESCLTAGSWNMTSELDWRLRLARLDREQRNAPPLPADEAAPRRLHELICLASSAVRYFTLDGTIYGGGDPAVDDSAPVISDPTSSCPTTRPGQASAPSLFEVALQAVQSTYDLRELPEQIPCRVRAALHTAARAALEGNAKCSMCRRSFIVARAEWTEYWHSGPASTFNLDSVLPFFRRTCSWSCAVPTVIGTSLY